MIKEFSITLMDKNECRMINTIKYARYSISFFKNIYPKIRKDFLKKRIIEVISKNCYMKDTLTLREFVEFIAREFKICINLEEINEELLNLEEKVNVDYNCYDFFNKRIRPEIMEIFFKKIKIESNQKFYFSFSKKLLFSEIGINESYDSNCEYIWFLGEILRILEYHDLILYQFSIKEETVEIVVKWNE